MRRRTPAARPFALVEFVHQTTEVIRTDPRGVPRAKPSCGRPVALPVADGIIDIRLELVMARVTDRPTSDDLTSLATQRAKISPRFTGPGLVAPIPHEP